MALAQDCYGTFNIGSHDSNRCAVRGQLCEKRRISLRARALAAVNRSNVWQSAQQIASDTGLTYRQTIDALNALHNDARVARRGRKFTATWGSIVLIESDPAVAAAHDLARFFLGIKHHETHSN
ncbi:hypothetical protein OKW42_005242 [Paraburkholderia sp. WC7.3d]